MNINCAFLQCMKYFNLLFILVLVLNCKSNNSISDEGKSFEEFPSSEKLDLSFFKNISEISADGLLNYKDSLLIIRNAANTSNYHFTAFDINKKNKVFDILESGRRDGQSMAFLSYGIYGDKLWVFDIVKNKFIVSQITEAESKYDLPINTISTFYYGIQPLKNETFLGTGDYDSDYRAAIVDTRNNNVIRQIDSYPKNISRGQKMAYESFLFVNPIRDKAVLAARFTDRVQIIDLKTETSTVLNGPANFKPSVDFMTGNDGKEISYSNDKGKYAFVKGKTTDDFIYLLFSGNNQNGPNRHYGKIIYIYSWDGKPEKKLILPDYILDFVISSDNSTIYTCNPNKKIIEFSALNL